MRPGLIASDTAVRSRIGAVQVAYWRRPRRSREGLEDRAPVAAMAWNWQCVRS